MSGQDLVRQLEQLPVDRNSRPLQDAMVSNCGELVRQVKGKTQRIGGFVHDFTDNQLGWFLVFVSILTQTVQRKRKRKARSKWSHPVTMIPATPAGSAKRTKRRNVERTRPHAESVRRKFCLFLASHSFSLFHFFLSCFSLPAAMSMHRSKKARWKMRCTRWQR